jgi:hypothetical protein
MPSWDVRPDPPRIFGPWFLWKLLIDERFQGRGYGREAVRLVANIARDQGASELLTSHVAGERSPESRIGGLSRLRLRTLAWASVLSPERPQPESAGQY